MEKALQGGDFAGWKTVGYVRLSREDESRVASMSASESQSIASQRAIIQNWASENRVSVQKFYVDDGYTGATFKRPSFEQMMADAQNGLFNTIVVKDLSRFGRSYLDCGQWIERKLPRMGIRLYSIADAFDSTVQFDQNTAILLPMKNLINEMYVIQTSEKVRASLASKREHGECVKNWAPYGYKKDPTNKHRLVADYPACDVVKRIFATRADGLSAAAIARMLNSEKIPCPAVYKQQRGSKYQTCFIGDSPSWHAKTVLRILRDETYTGTLVQGKTRRPNWRLRVGLPVPKNQWCRSIAAHEALVERELFLEVADRIG